MPLSLYDVTVPAFLHAFQNLSAELEKARAFADEKGISHGDFTEARLFPDMLPLTGQVQRASDTAKFVPARIAGVAAPAMPDTEQSFDDMQARIAATADFLRSVPPEAFAEAENASVTLKFRAGDITLSGRDYVLRFALPNFYFHVTTAYDILRHKGLPLSKRDFLGLA